VRFGDPVHALGARRDLVVILELAVPVLLPQEFGDAMFKVRLQDPLIIGAI
jgi:hypothetical protein